MWPANWGLRQEKINSSSDDCAWEEWMGFAARATNRPGSSVSRTQSFSELVKVE